jgi:hypothetical protein
MTYLSYFKAILSIKTGSDVSVVIEEELPTDYQNEVTTVICRKIRPGHEKDYNDWVRRYLTLERKAYRNFIGAGIAASVVVASRNVYHKIRINGI